MTHSSKLNNRSVYPSRAPCAAKLLLKAAVLVAVSQAGATSECRLFTPFSPTCQLWFSYVFFVLDPFGLSCCLAYLAAEYIECGSLDFNLFPIGTDKFKHDFQSHRHHTQSSARVGIRKRSLSSPVWVMPTWFVHGSYTLTRRERWLWAIQGMSQTSRTLQLKLWPKIPVEL